MWKNKKVSLVFPTYNEKDSIKKAIVDFEDTGYIDEIIVVNNNAAEGTSEEVKKANSKITKEIFETKQGYGNAIRAGFKVAKGDLIIVSEPDGTFFGNDVVKLLAYSDDFDVVYGSRTAKELIWRGANMGWFLRWGNFVVAKLMEVLFNTTNLTDVGCTMRVIHRDKLKIIEKYFRVGREHFGPEMMILSFVHQLNAIQIPVNYQERIGESSVTGDIKKSIRLGLIMIALILKFRFTYFGRFHLPTIISLIVKSPRIILTSFKKIPGIYILAIIHFAYFFGFVYLRWRAHQPIMDYHAYVQMLWNTSEGNILFYNQNRNHQIPFFNLHFAPFLILISYIYKIFQHPLTLYFVFMTFVSASVIPVFKISKDIFKNKLNGYLATFIYMLYPPFMWSYMQGFAEEAFATPLLVFAFYFMYKKKPWLYVLFSIFILSLRINMAVPVFMLALYGLYTNKIRAQVVFVGLLSIVWLLYTRFIITTAYTPPNTKPYIYASFDLYGENPKEILTTIFTNPTVVINNVFTEYKYVYIKDLFKSLLYFPILGLDILLISAPILLINLLSSNPRLTSIYAYYHASITPFIIIATIYAVYRASNLLTQVFNRILNPGLKTVNINIFIMILQVLLILNLISINRNNSYGAYLTFSKYFNQQLLDVNQRDIQIDKILRSIPEELSLATQAPFMEHIAERRWYLDHNKQNGYLPDIIFIDTLADNNYATYKYEQTGWVRLMDVDYLQMYARKDIVVEYNAEDLIKTIEEDNVQLDPIYTIIDLGVKNNAKFQAKGTPIDVTADVVFLQKLEASTQRYDRIEIPIEKITVPTSSFKAAISNIVKKPRGSFKVEIIEGNEIMPEDKVILSEIYTTNDLTEKADLLSIDLNNVEIDEDKRYWIRFSLDKNDGKDYGKYNVFRLFIANENREVEDCERLIDYEKHNIRLSGNNGKNWRNPYCDQELLYSLSFAPPYTKNLKETDNMIGRSSIIYDKNIKLLPEYLQENELLETKIYLIQSK